MLTSHQHFEAAVNNENKDLWRWFLDSDHSKAGTHLSDWLASDLTEQTEVQQYTECHIMKEKTLQQSQLLFTMLSDVVKALLLDGLVIYETLDFRGGAVNIRVLKGIKRYKAIMRLRTVMTKYYGNY